MDRYTGSGPAEDRAWSAWADALKPGDSVRHDDGRTGVAREIDEDGVTVRDAAGDAWFWSWRNVWPVEVSA